FLTKNKKATAASLAEVALNSEYIFLAVKPQGMASLFQTLAPMLKTRTDDFVLVSMAAGVSIFDIQSMADVPCSIIRIMPNTPVSVGEGMILYDVNEKTTEAQINGFLQGLSLAGKLDRLPEYLIDAAGSLSGCGPAFVYLFAEALADGGVACGLPRQKANLYAAQTLIGAAKMLLETGKHAGELKDAVCSPGGTTIAGVHALEEGAFRADAMNAVIAAYEKTKLLKS
ncbi:MAG: pyrroline-5-carboxylate reductase, partial [Clostridia bacterium]|nr:pyrroline-5-carboxylate reductase [Clostridia bacterium]